MKDLLFILFLIIGIPASYFLGDVVIAAIFSFFATILYDSALKHNETKENMAAL